MKQLTKDEFPKYTSSLYTRKTNNPIKKWGKDLNRHFSKQDIQIANRHMKRCPTLLIIREMRPNHDEMSPHTGQDCSLLEKCNQNHNEMSPHTGQDGHGQKKSINNKCWRGCGEKGTLLHCWWECKLIQPLWNTVWRFLKKLGIKPPYDPAIPLLGIYPEESKTERDTCTHCSV